MYTTDCNWPTADIGSVATRVDELNQSNADNQPRVGERYLQGSDGDAI